MPTYRISTGFQMNDEAAARLLSQGVSLELFTGVVRVLALERSLNDTIITIDAGTFSTADQWRRMIIDDVNSMEEIELPVVEDPDPPPEALDTWTKVGQWTKTAGVSTTTISSLPSTPKGIIVWGCGLAGADFNTFSEAGALCIGFSNGTDNYDMAYASNDNVATSNANQSIKNKAFHLLDPTGDATGHMLENCTISFSGTSFTMNWSATTNATKGHYYVFGGDDIFDVKLKLFTVDTTLAGIREYIGLGNQYDFGLFLWPTVSNTTWTSNGLADAALNISAIAGPNINRCWSTSIRVKDDSSPSSTHRLQKRVNMFSGMGAASANEAQRAKFDSWTLDGFKVNWKNTPDDANGNFVGFFVKGGRWDAGYFYQPNAIGTVRTLLLDKYSLIQGIMGFSNGNTDTTSSSSGNTNAKWMISGADKDGGDGCMVAVSNNGANPTVEATEMRDDKFVKSIDAVATASSSTVTSEATVSDLATAGEFTVDYSAADTIHRQVLWFTLSK